MKTKSIKCSFKNSRGYVLDGRIDYPAGIEDEKSLADDARAFIIFCHCFTCSKETITTFRLSRLLAAMGYAVLRFDFTGLGNSEGVFSSTSFSTTQDDLRSAIDFLDKRYHPPAFLMGHSLGGTTALSVAQHYENIKGVVTIASPSEPAHVLHHFGHALTLLEQDIAASFEVAGQFFDIEPGFVNDVRSIDMRSCLSELDKPVLVINIEGDRLVSEKNADQIKHWSAGETTLLTVKNTDHLLTDKAASEYAAQQIFNWLSDR